VANSSVEVQEAAKRQFQVELTGSTEGLTFDVPAEAARPNVVRFMNENFVRLR
jgi:hypothetical protein